MQAPPSKREDSEASGSEREPPGPVVIGRYRVLLEALVAKSILDSAEIQSFLADENLVRLGFHLDLLGGAKLMVCAEDAETAKKLLEEKIPEKINVTGVGEYAQPRCPKCGSMDVGFDEIDKVAHAAMALFGVPLGITHKGGTCHACGHEWDYGGGPAAD